MKRILAVMLTTMMLFSLISSADVAAEQILNPVSIYAGIRTITAEYGTKTLATENVGDIVLTTVEGTAVPFTTKINDEFLSIIADEEFVRDTQSYLLQIGGQKKVFKIKTLFKPQFEADTANGKVNDLHISQGSGTVVDVVDKNTVILSTNAGSIVLDYDEIANYENASLAADVYFVGPTNQSASRGTFAYNVSAKAHDYAYLGEYAPRISRAVWYLDSLSNAFYKRMTAVTNGTELLAYPGFSNTILPIGSSNVSAMSCVLGEWAYGSAYTAGATTVGTATLPQAFDGETRKYRHVIDKMGAVGTLMVNNTFVDIMDSQDYYDEYNDANGTELSAATTGYFVINPLVNLSGNYRIMLSDIALITSEMRDYGEGTLTASAEVIGEEVEITLSGAENIDISGVEAEDYISFSEGLTYNVVSKTRNKIVIKPVTPQRNHQYILTVSAGFGYDNLLVAENQIFNITFPEEIQNIELTASAEVIGEEVEITLSGAENIDISGVAAENYISFSEGLTYNVVSKTGNKIVIKPVTPQRNHQYTLTVSAGFGYDNLLVAENQIFNITFPEEIQDAEILEPISIYAGARTITVEYDTETLNDGNVGDILLTTLNGETVGFTTKINNRFLSVIADEEFVRDEQEYFLKIGNISRVFKIKTLFTPEFVADTSNNTVKDLYICEGDGAAVDVVDKDTLILTTLNGNFVLDYDEIANYENASLVADVYYASSNNTATTGVLAYNVSSREHTYAYIDPNGAGKVSRALWYLDGGVIAWPSNPRYFDRMVAVTDGKSMLSYKGYKADDRRRPLTELNGTIMQTSIKDHRPGTAYTAGTTTVGTTQLEFDRTVNKYHYVIDKMGAVGTLMMNDTFIDIMDSQDYYDEYNEANGTELSAATKGYFVINPLCGTATAAYRTVVSNMALITSEMETGGVKISQNDITINGISASGNIKVRNCFEGDAKKAAVIVSAYGENNKFLGAKKVIDTELLSGQITGASYSFSASEEIKEIKAEIIDETSILFEDEVTVTSALQTDFENNIITVKGNIEADDKERKLCMLVSKNNQEENWNVTNEGEGSFITIIVPAEATTFEYSFNYEDNSDTPPYEMSIYAITWEDGIKMKKMSSYNYASNEAVLEFVDKLKTNKTTFDEVVKYAQALGVDVSYADTAYKKDVLVETIYNERENITSGQAIGGILSKAKARAEFLTALKTTTNIARVDEIISLFAAQTGLDITVYNKLSDSGKSRVCTMFVRADYENSGYESFAEAFYNAVNSANSSTFLPVGGGITGDGGGSGGNSGGGGGGVSVAPVTPAVPEEQEKVFSDMTEYKWAEEAVGYLAKNKIISGTGNNKFNPEGIITREQMAKIIVLAFGVYDDNAASDYADVDTDGWSVKYIASAKKAGLMNGIEGARFEPLAPITREDLAVILYRALVKNGEIFEVRKSGFADNREIAGYALDAVEYIAGAGIINGFEDGSFRPKSPATRAQAAVLIYNALTGGEHK